MGRDTKSARAARARDAFRAVSGRWRLSLLCVALVGCPPADKKEPRPTETRACTTFGQSCEVSPGKLGTCVRRAGCDDPGAQCFVCQSQH